MSIIQIATPFNIDLEFEIAEFHKRLLAYIIDFGILLLFFISMKNLYYGSYDNISKSILQSHIGIDIITISLPMLLYSLVCEVAMHGQTIGKKLMKIRVISLEGGEPALSQYLVRWMFRAWEWPFMFGYTFFSELSIIYYTFITGFLGIAVVIIIGFTKKSQRLGDIAANTAVVNTRSSLSVTDTIFMDIKETDYQVKFPEVLKLTDRDINTIKNVLSQYQRTGYTDTVNRVAGKVQEVLKISMAAEDNQNPVEFLGKLLADYNYLATKE